MTGRSSLWGIGSTVVRRPAQRGLVLASIVFAACSPAPPAAVPEGAASADPTAAPTAAASTTATAGTQGSASPSASATAAPSGSASASGPALPAVTLGQSERTKISGKPPVLGIVAPSKNLVIAAAKAAAFEVKLSAKEYKPAAGDHLCLLFDKKPCRRIDDVTKPIPLGELGPLEEGQHVVSIFARRASGEVLRAGKSAPFASVSFFVGKRVPPVHKDGEPMLFLSVPDKGPAPGEGVLVDFFLANAEVRSGSYVIAASVGGPGIENGVGFLVETDKPLRIKAARPGEYLVRLTLLEFVPSLGESKSRTTVTYTSRPMTTPFAEVTRSIFVTK